MSTLLTPAKPDTFVPAALERVRSWLRPLNLHFAGVGLLALVNLYLLIHLSILWQAASGNNAEAVNQQKAALQRAETAAEPLRGLDTKLEAATSGADQFYRKRLPVRDSEVVAELGALTKAQHVRLTRGQYTPTLALAGSAGELTELRIDASLSGDYRPLVQFINSLERDKMFFVISGVGLSGQQSGAVNLRLRLTTYLTERASASAVGAGATTGAEKETASAAVLAGGSR